jgi:hypothetical protein
MPDVYIVGCHHALQSVEVCWRWLIWEEHLKGIGRDVREMAMEQKRKFNERLWELKEGYGVTFIGEEAEPNAITWASRLGVRWENIDMPPAERDARGIPRNYAGNPDYPACQRAGWDAQREEYMLDQIERLRGTAQSIMVVSGSEHLTPLEGLLSAAGYSVWPPEDVTKSKWFDVPDFV